MKVQTLAPPPPIAAIVSHIVVLENNSLFYEAVLPLIATGFPSVTFQLTDPARILTGEKKCYPLVLYGQNTKPLQLHTAGEVVVIAYFLYPWLLPSLFGYSAAELTDQGIDLSLYGPARKSNLKEQLLNISSGELNFVPFDGAHHGFDGSKIGHFTDPAAIKSDGYIQGNSTFRNQARQQALEFIEKHMK